LAFTKVLTIYQIYLNVPPPLFSFIPSLPIQEVLSTGISFPFTFVGAQYSQHIHPLTPFPHLLPLPLVSTTPRQGLFLFSNFAKERKK
jgi:hypothetical protein